MVNDDKQYHYIYKTTNTITGRYYIGMHTTNNLEDGYLGSGKVLKRSICKYGLHSHIKEILLFCNTREVLVSEEKEIVTEDVLNDPLCMNIRLGGEGGGGWTSEQQQENNRKSQIAQAQLREDNQGWVQQKHERVSATLRQQYQNGERLATTQPHPKGWKHSEQTKERIRQSHIGQGVGERNSQFGTCWIYSDDEQVNKKISKDELECWLGRGWNKGRKRKYCQNGCAPKLESRARL